MEADYFSAEVGRLFMKTFEISKEYRFILIPVFMVVITWCSIPPFPKAWGWILPFITAWVWRRFFVTPYRVEISEDNRVILHRLIGTKTVRPHEILKIEDWGMSLKIYHTGGRIVLTTLMNDVYSLKRNLESMNPEIVSKDIQEKRFEKYKRRTPLILIVFIFVILFVRYFLMTG